MSQPRSPLPPRSLTRRSFVAGTASVAAAALLTSCSTRIRTRAPRFPAYPFTLGVASGDPSPDGAVLWTRLAPTPLAPGGGMEPETIEVSWQVAEDEAMTRVVRSGRVEATPEWAHSVHAEVSGLQPERWYWYEFRAGGEVSPKGRLRTMPAANVLPERLRFAFASCQHYETGYFTAFDHLAREDIDLVVHLGDYIYESGIAENRTRRHNSDVVKSLDGYRARYALYKSDPSLQAAHAAAPWLVTWDDHEVANNYAADIAQLSDKMQREEFLRRRAAAYQAYFEHMPLRRSARPRGPDLQLYRRVAFGGLATFHVLDTRQYRTDQPCGDGTREPCPDALNPEATLLGAEQREWLFRGLEESPTTWNVLAQQVMMAPVDRNAGPERALSMDQWPGYEFERRRVLRHFRERQVKNPVVLTGDIHSNWANELWTDFDRLDGQSAGVEFVGTSISSGGDGAEPPRHLDALLAQNPFVKFHNTERGYVHCDLSPKEWRTHFRTVPYVTRPGAPLNTRASFVVEAGQPRLHRA